MNIDNTYNPTNISKNYLSGQEFTNQVSIDQGFNVELFEVSDKLAFIKNFGNVAVFKDGSKGLLIDTGMGVSSNQVINKLKEWGIDEIEYIIYTHGHVDQIPRLQRSSGSGGGGSRGANSVQCDIRLAQFAIGLAWDSSGYWQIRSNGGGIC